MTSPASPHAPSGVDRQYFDEKVRAQDDLYRHVNGGWLSSTEIPSDRALVGTMVQLRDEAEANVRALIEELATAEHPDGSDESKIGAYYRSFMDADAVERLGAAPLQPLLAEIHGVDDVASLVATSGRLGRGGTEGLFGYYAAPDAGNPERVVLYISQGGLGLPDESYYRESKFAEVVTAYEGYLRDAFALLGSATAEADAAAVLGVEKRIAGLHWDRVTLRDPQKTYNLRTEAQASEAFPHFAAWALATGITSEARAELVVGNPDFLPGITGLLEELPLQSWKLWLTAHLLGSSAPFLSAVFVDRHFALYGTVLSGTPQNKERWKRGVGAVEAGLGMAVGRLYVARHFPEGHKEAMEALVANIVEAYRESISGLPWMSEDTRQRALEKLAAFRPKIGYPDEWIDFSGVVVDDADLLGNVRRASAAELDRLLDEIGKPVDRVKWLMTPQTVNAYYHPLMNEIVFPAAILQQPFFHPDADPAVNYGGIAAVIGHEIGHGFDDQGSQFDGTGALRNWWTDEDRTAFVALTSRLVDQFDALSPAETPGHTVNGRLTLGENIGDLGGIGIAYKAYQLSLDGEEAPAIDGLTGAQRFFISWATVWRQVCRPEETLRRLSIDPHSPNEFRTNAIVKNVDAFHSAFDVTEGDGMWLAPEERVTIW
ncbi:M13-type metalloendopeptidase [Sinomonas sp. ASV486]|uniref:M13 family metallopeptidase n=1 Tax=Sinomonas sp. ASV486 TaxID=3051170 RepID=UPI0027DC429B|nr:M13-type metalloendopeptidase [Sinomonas sp. ASV486]MDQ4491428.1 M13-type metalloendopeptidase [Sinomonas sp. ASV486]